MARVFVSHASADLPAAVEIRTWLREAGHQVFLDRDLAEGIQLGEEWKRRLYKELRAADAVVCVITDAYRDSAWCAAEIGIADMLGSPLLPVRVGEGAAPSLLDGLQYADAHADSTRARAELTARLKAIDAAGASGWDDTRSPYPGLKPFEADMARVFRGRSVEVRQLTGRLRSLGERAGGALLVVVGPSGCGKSSLVRAGLLPAMAAEPGWETVMPFTPDTDPVAALGWALTETANRAGLAWTVAATAAALADCESGLARLADELRVHGRQAARERLLVVVDQGEELLTRADAASLARFARLLGAGLAGPVRVVVTLRSEFLDRLHALLKPEGIDIDPPFLLSPLDAAMLPAAVAEPAAVAGLGIDAELVDRLVADTRGGEALPLLAFTLAELARGKTRGDELSAQAYADLGGVQGALARRADASLDAASEASGLEPADVLAGLTRLATLDATGQPTRRQIPLAGVEEALQAAFSVFVDSRLLLTTTETDETWVGVAHEALLSAWGPLADAVESRRTALREVRTVEQAAAEWHGNGRAAAYLWDGDRLTAALVALDQPAAIDRTLPGRLSRLDGVDPTGREFLATSAGHALGARERTRRRRAAVVTGLSVLLVVAVALGSLAAVFGSRAADQAAREQQRADQAERTLTAQRLLTRAEITRDVDRTLALQLAVAAHAVSPHPQAKTAADASLLETLSTPRPLGNPIGRTGPVVSVVLSIDGRTLATGSAGDGVQLWDVADPAHPRPLGNPLAGHVDSVSSVVISPDGRVLASAFADGTVWLWDVADPNAPTPLGSPITGHTDSVQSVAFSPDGRTLATGSTDRTIRLWDARRLSELRRDVVRIACEQAGGLDRQTWELHVPDVDFPDPCKV